VGRVSFTGGMHAAEYVSIEAVRRLSRWADPASPRGTLIAVLIVNRVAVELTATGH
jgi:predicted deacylase